MTTPFLPRPARLSLTIRGAKQIDLRLDMQQARMLNRTLKRMRELAVVDSDSDLIEYVIAVLGQELLANGIEPPQP